MEYSSQTATTVAVAAIAFVLFGFAIQSDKTETATRVRRSIYALGALLAGTILNNSLVGQSHELREGLSQSMATVESDGNLTWHLDDATAYEQTRRERKPVFIDFYGSWCTNCKAFQELTHSNSELNAALQRAVLLKVRDRVPQFKKFAADERFPELTIGLPFFVITDSNRNLLYKTNDYLKTDEMLLFLNE